MHCEKEGPAAPGSAHGVRKSTGEVNIGDDTSLYTQTQRRAAAKLAAAFGLSLSFALTIAVMAGLGG